MNSEGCHESWVKAEWAKNEYVQHPAAVIPSLPQNLTALHGLTIEESEENYRNYVTRINYLNRLCCIMQSKKLARERIIGSYGCRACMS